MADALQDFLLALSALFSIVNPIGSSLIFSQVTADRTHEERTELARRIAVYSSLIMLGALWIGTVILNLFGVSIAALRIAGGFVVAFSAWNLLQQPEQNEERKQEQAAQVAKSPKDVAFFPLTMPFTTGPGTIAVSIALGANLPAGEPGEVGYFIGVSCAAIVIAIMVLIAYSSADFVVSFLGPQRVRVVSRLAAFLLLCVGVEIMLNGLSDFAETLERQSLEIVPVEPAPVAPAPVPTPGN